MSPRGTPHNTISYAFTFVMRGNLSKKIKVNCHIKRVSRSKLKKERERNSYNWQVIVARGIILKYISDETKGHLYILRAHRTMTARGERD